MISNIIKGLKKGAPVEGRKEGKRMHGDDGAGSGHPCIPENWEPPESLGFWPDYCGRLFLGCGNHFEQVNLKLERSAAGNVLAGTAVTVTEVRGEGEYG